jgi:hypothetical protein
MAKNKTLKRTITKTGEVRYYEGPKRLKNKAGQRKWIKANTNAPVQSLTKSEQRSLKAIQRYNESWKFNGVQIQPIYIQVLKKLKVPLNKAKNKDLATLNFSKDGKPFTNWSAVLRLIDIKAKSDKKFFKFCTEVGLPNYRKRDYETFKDNTIKNIVDFIELINTESLKNYTLVVIDPQGDEQRGRVKAILALRDFEIMVGEALNEVAKNSAFMKFCYSYNLDIKKREILVDLTDRNELKDLQDYVTKDDTNKGDTLSISDKYKDVDIEIQFS